MTIRARHLWPGAAVALTLVAAAAGAQQPAAPARLSDAARTAAVVRAARPFTQETIEIKLGRGEGMEYKYRLEKGGTLLFSWTADGTVHYELHSEPVGAPRGFAESFDKKDAAVEAHGAYTAPFPGIHGWYWENRSGRDVTVTLKTAGPYVESREFRKGMNVKIKKF
jgi:hypothetical protein